MKTHTQPDPVQGYCNTLHTFCVDLSSMRSWEPMTSSTGCVTASYGSASGRFMARNDSSAPRSQSCARSGRRYVSIISCRAQSALALLLEYTACVMDLYHGAMGMHIAKYFHAKHLQQ